LDALIEICEARKSTMVSIIHRHIDNLGKQTEDQLGAEIEAWISGSTIPAMQYAIGMNMTIPSENLAC
jgi:hypothetical protein